MKKRTKRWTRLLSAALVAALVFTSYTPAFAMDDAEPEVPQRFVQEESFGDIPYLSPYTRGDGHQQALEFAKQFPILMYEQNGKINIEPGFPTKYPLEVKLGDDGEWTPYREPFAPPRSASMNIYTRSTDPELIYYEWVLETKGVTVEYGQYHEQASDGSLSIGQIAFDFTRTYDPSSSCKWFFATDSNIQNATYLILDMGSWQWYAEYSSEKIKKVTLPDQTELTLFCGDKDIYTDGSGEWTLQYENGKALLKNKTLTYTYGKEYSTQTIERLEKIEDIYGNSISIQRSAQSITVTDSYSRTYTLALTNGKITSLTDPMGRVTQYAYQGFHLSTVTDPSGVVTGSYTYSYGQLTKSNDKTISYSDIFVTSIEGDNGSRVNYIYDNSAQKITLTDTAGNTNVYSFDSQLLISSADGASYSYDDKGRISSVTQNGVVTAYTYDSNGNTTCITTDGKTTEYSYNADDRVIREKDEEGNYTYYEYDSLGSVLLTATLKDASGTIPAQYTEANAALFDVVTNTYRADGLLLTSTDSKNNAVTTYQYDSYGYPTATTTVKTYEDNTTDTAESTSSYDKTGRLLSQTSNGETEDSLYDAAGRTLRVQNGSQVTRSLYDAKGRLIQQISSPQYDAGKDGLNQAPPVNTYSDSNAGVRYTYAENGNLTSMINSYDQETTYTYDANGNPSGQSMDIYGFTTTKQGNPSNVTVGGSNLVSYTYQKFGNEEKLTSESWANGQSVNLTYSDSGNITGIRYGGEESDAYTFAYGPTGKLTEQTDTATGIRTVYGENDRVEQYAGNSDSPYHWYEQTSNSLTEQSFDSVERTTYKEYSDEYMFYPEKRHVSTFQKDAEGRTIWDRHYEAGKTRYGEYHHALFDTTYAYDGNNLSSIVHTFMYYGSQISPFTFNYSYTEDGMISEENRNGNKTNYTYDDEGQLIRTDSQAQNKTIVYLYDDRGNMTQRKTYAYTTSNDLSALSVLSTDSYSYENTTWADQLTSVNGNAVTYDTAGNRTTYDGWTYVWEAGRRLKRMTKDGSVIDYKYDAEGIRTQKTVNNVATQYTTVDGRITGQNDGTNQLYFRYDRNGKAYGMTINHGGNYTTITNYFYITNAQGDVVGMVDEDGVLQCTYEYDDWGNLLSMEGDQTLASLNPIRYRGYYLDQETGLYYLQSRYYDPSVMRFINADDPNMLGLSSLHVNGINLITYCLNNPIMSSDPSGYRILPVGGFGSFYNNYSSAVLAWAKKYAKMSNGVEYGAIIYRFRVLFSVRYFMGETYKGFKTPNWYTVINGLGFGYLVGRGMTRAVNFFWPVASLAMIGFAHTHPKGNSNYPSGPDKLMKAAGGVFAGMWVFPIAVFSNNRLSIRYF